MHAAKAMTMSVKRNKLSYSDNVIAMPLMGHKILDRK